MILLVKFTLKLDCFSNKTFVMVKNMSVLDTLFLLLGREPEMSFARIVTTESILLEGCQKKARD